MQDIDSKPRVWNMWKKIWLILAFPWSVGACVAVEVNTAKAADLDSIKGIGPALSGRIIEERRKGPYKSWQDLVRRVDGLGTRSAARLSAEGLTVGGTTHDAAPPAPPSNPASR